MIFIKPKNNRHLLSLIALAIIITTTSSSQISPQKQHDPDNSQQHQLRRHLQQQQKPTSPEDNNNISVRDGWPELAWLLTYPQSRASYVMKIVHETFDRTTASNYEGFYKEMAEDDPGPFRLKHNMPFPNRYMLTETRCGGTCLEDCDEGEKRFVRSVKGFYNLCASGRRRQGDSSGGVERPGKNNKVGPIVQLYDPQIVNKAVHLIRDPFDNLIHRFRDEAKEYGYKNNGAKWEYEDNRKGLLDWCKAFESRADVKDEAFADFSERLNGLTAQIPCYAIIFQYVQWHNNVVDIIEQNNIPSLVVHYQSFRDDIEGTLGQLSEFLSLSRRPGGGAPRKPNPDNYEDYLSDTDRSMISSFIKVLAAQETWHQLYRYLPKPDYEKRFSLLGTKLSPIHYGAWPDIAWLMTFPNSGTGYITQITHRLSGGTTTATNYANEMKKIYRYLPNFAATEYGPFRNTRLPFPDGYILTKTHCQHCMNCHPTDDLEIKLGEFVKGCTRVGMYDDDGKGMAGYYDPAITKKVVHVIRSPFDNIVANFHYQYKRDVARRGTSKYSYNREGFRAWCKWHDDKYTDNDYMIYGKKTAAVAKNIPCHGVFFQYIQWHNNAFRIPDRLGVPALVLYYEDFHHDRTNVLNQLLEFLEIKRVNNAPPFYYSPYPDHYTEEEVKAAATFVMMMGSPETIKGLERYFVTSEDDTSGDETE